MNADLSEWAVWVEDLVKVYSGGVRALNGVSIRVRAGELRAILGPNGAGKTTLMRILTTQITPTKGRAYVFGYDVAKEGDRVRRMLGYVPQEFSLWTELTGYENMLIYAKIYGIPGNRRRSIIEEALDFMELREAANRLVRTYSGGMLRRLEIAVALMLRPKILFLDEPTIGLDPRAREMVWRRLLEFRKEYGCTIYFNTHYMDEAERYAERITILNRGTVIAEGTTEELKRYAKVFDRVTLRIEEADVGADVVKLISDVPGASLLKYSNGEVILESSEPSKVLPIVIELLESRGIKVREASISRASLDDVFIKLTGMTMEEAERASLREVMSLRRAIKRGG